MKVNPQSVVNGVKDHLTHVPAAPGPELDELYPFLGKKTTTFTSQRLWIGQGAVCSEEVAVVLD